MQTHYIIPGTSRFGKRTKTFHTIPHIGCGSATISRGLCRPFFGLSRFCPPPILHLGAHHTLHHICIAVALNRSTATRSTAVKKMLNSNGARTHPCRTPCSMPNQSEHSPSSVRMSAGIPSWKWRTTASIFGDAPNRANTVHQRVRSTESYASVRSTKQI